MVGVVLLVAAAGVLAFSVSRIAHASIRTDAVLPVDARSHPVGVEVGRVRELWVERPQATHCTLNAARHALAMHPLRGTGQTRIQGRRWYGVGTFRASVGTISVRCSGPLGTTARIGEAVTPGSLFGALARALVLPLLIGLAGCVALLVGLIRVVRSRVSRG